MLRFTKMQGCGNDYIYINCLEEFVKDPKKLAITMSERHFGVGADGLVLIYPSAIGDFRMEMYNLDGSESEMCGNAVRCIGKYVYERGLTHKTRILLETKGGVRYLDLQIENGIVAAITVDMGEPIFEPEEIPVKSKMNPVIGEKVELLDQKLEFTCLSVGNPHAVTFVDSVANFPVEKYGRIAETHPVFPNRANIEFVEVVNESYVKMRVWERGSGETWACGTGATASVVACVLNGRTGRKVDVELLGGTLTIEWNEEDNHLYMTGPAAFSFDGVWLGEV